MKLTARLLKATTVWLAALGVASAVHAQSRDMQALVRSVSGSATFNVEGQPALPIKAGARLPAGATIRTGAGSSVDLFLGRGAGVLRLGENGILGIEKLSISDTGSDIVTDTQLNLLGGEILGTVNKLSGGSHYEIKTPAGLAGVSGGQYRIQVPGTISVLTGTLVFVQDGKAHVVKGPGEYDPGSPNPAVRRLRADEIPTLQQAFQGLDNNPQPARIPPPPPQSIRLSPI
jgi:hypothetical protein